MASYNSVIPEYTSIQTFLDYNDVRAVEKFKGTARCIFKCETTQMKLAKNIRKGFVSKNVFVQCNILSNPHVI